MSDPLREYNERLDRRRISAWVPPQDMPGPKFGLNGDIQPFYGLTCIAWIDRESRLFRRLCEFQGTVRGGLERAGVGGLFSFLVPESFHVTICDVDADPDPARIRLDERIEQVRGAFERIGRPGSVSSLISGVGLGLTITALVRFDAEPGELEKVQAMEREIKRATGENVREFTGHVSLAYLVRHPGRHTDRIKEILLPYEGRAFGRFSFSRFDLTWFSDMNTYVPLLTLDLEEGAVTRHDRSREGLRR